jgi:hypothetical protein
MENIEKTENFVYLMKILEKMLTTIEGVYENGRVIFNEIPPVKKKSKIFITFLEDAEVVTKLKKRRFGTLKGTIPVPDDFNEPLDEL